jgi:rhamnosyltransferase
MTSISIAMATYNGGRFIREQLESLARQTVLPMELIITDDGSTDDTLKVVADFAQQAPFPVEVHRNTNRLGYAANFMKCANLCRGELIAFCDQDDVWQTRKLELCADALTDDRLYMVYHNATISDDIAKEGRPLYGQQKARDLIKPLGRPLSYYALGFTIIFRRSLLLTSSLWERSLNYNLTNVHIGHDLWIGMIANFVGPVAYIPDSLAMYRLHQNNVVLRKGGLLKKISLNISSSTDRARNAFYLYSRVADLLCSNDSDERFCKDFLAASTILRRMARWMKSRTDLYCERQFIERIRKITALFLQGAYGPKRQGGLGLYIMIKDITVGLLFGGSKLLVPHLIRT